MRKYVQKQCWLLVAVVLLSVGLIGCNQDNRGGPTTPELIAHTAARQNAARPGNFYAGRGLSDEFGAYVGHGEFVVQVPAGEYLLEYTTDLGTFYLVFRATASSLLYIGLQPDDVVHDAIVYTGTITDTSGETQEHGNVTLFVWPGSARAWHEVFRMS